MHYFLVEFDHSRNQARWQEFKAAGPALEQLSLREAERLPHVEVVLLMANSLDELKKTHGRYFQTAAELVLMAH